MPKSESNLLLAIDDLIEAFRRSAESGLRIETFFPESRAKELRGYAQSVAQTSLGLPPWITPDPSVH